MFQKFPLNTPGLRTIFLAEAEAVTPAELLYISGALSILSSLCALPPAGHPGYVLFFAFSLAVSSTLGHPESFSGDTEHPRWHPRQCGAGQRPEAADHFDQ